MTAEDIVKRALLKTMEGEILWSIIDHKTISKRITDLSRGISVTHDRKARRDLIARKTILERNLKNLNPDVATKFGLKILVPTNKKRWWDETRPRTIQVVITVSIKEEDIYIQVNRGDVIMPYSSVHFLELVTLSFLLRDPRNIDPVINGEIRNLYDFC